MNKMKAELMTSAHHLDHNNNNHNSGISNNHHHHHSTTHLAPHTNHLQEQHYQVINQNQTQPVTRTTDEDHLHNTAKMAQQHLNQQAQPQAQQNGPKPRGRRKKIRTEPIRPICPQCEKQFSNQSALTKHKLTHSDERKFACQQCSKAFKRHDHLTGHMQTHSNRKPFNCTIQGCDKTYCDARSLRRHKENIHHIITPPSQQQQQQPPLPPHHHHQQQQQQQQQQLQPQNLQPSHLLQRRIQRLHSDQGTYSCSGDPNGTLAGRGYLACNTAPINSHSIASQQVPHTANGLQHNNNQYLSNHQHASFSADYASTQQFNFEITNMNGYHIDHANSSSTIPLSADSVTDSGLDLNVHYEQLTPSHQQQSQPTPVIQQQQQQHQQQQQQPQPQPQPQQHQTTQLPPPLQLQQPRYHQHQYLSNHQHASFSADYASTQQFNFEITNMNGYHMDHAISSSTIPLSADSVTDSGLDLNVHYEQLTPSHQQQQQQQQPPQPQPQQTPVIQQQQHQQQPHQTTQLPPPLQLQQPRYHQQQVSYSAGYANPQHFDFESATAQTINGAPISTCGSTIDRDINNNLMNEQHSSYVTYISQEEELRS